MKPFLERKRKAQIIIFESVLIFTISVTIFIMCYAVFNIYQSSYFTPLGTDNQLTAVKDFVTAHILLLAEKEANSSVILPLPKLVGNDPYEIRLTKAGLNVTTLTMAKFSPLYNLGEAEFSLSGRILSNLGKIRIYKKAKQINIM